MVRSKEIKVKIPIQQHLQLHTLKLTQGITITEAVETALRNYFARGVPPDEEEPSLAGVLESE